MNSEVVLIGDIIKSRKKFDSDKWKEFHSGIKLLNKKYVPAFKIPLTVYSGDSFGAVVNDILAGIEIILNFPMAMDDYKARIVLIHGDVQFGMELKNMTNLEGPALWKSTEKIKELKTSDLYFGLEMDSKKFEKILQSNINLLLSHKYSWSSLQKAVYTEYCKDQTQKQIAKKLNTTQQYISQIIRKENFRIVKDAEESIYGLINEHKIWNTQYS